MLKKGSSEVAYLSRFSPLHLYPSHCVLIYYMLLLRHIQIFLYHLHHLNHLLMKMKMVRQENSNASRVHRGKRQSVMWQIFLEWMAKLLHGQLHMLLFWYVSVIKLVSTMSYYHSPTQLAFNLTDASYWMEVHNNFNFRALYALIVDFFEVPSGVAAQKRTKNLLKWWSTYVTSSSFVLFKLIHDFILSTGRFFLTIMVQSPTAANPGRS